MKRFFYFLFLLILISTTYISCVKEKLFPVEPSIEFKQFNKFSANAVLTRAECIIKFKDGDGDIGGDSTGIPELKMVYLGDSVNQDPQSVNYGKLTGIFVPHDQNTTAGFDTTIYYFRPVDITPKGQYKALEGEILIKMAAPFAFDPVFKYAITLHDRAGHLSNMVYTNEITNTP